MEQLWIALVPVFQHFDITELSPIAPDTEKLQQLMQHVRPLPDLEVVRWTEWPSGEEFPTPSDLQKLAKLLFPRLQAVGRISWWSELPVPTSNDVLTLEKEEKRKYDEWITRMKLIDITINTTCEVGEDVEMGAAATPVAEYQEEYRNEYTDERFSEGIDMTDE